MPPPMIFADFRAIAIYFSLLRLISQARAHAIR